MKKILVNLALIASVLCFFSSCDEKTDPDSLWDIAGLYITFDVVNPQGTSLLNAGVPGNIVGEPMSVTYQNKEYKLAWTLTRAQSSAPSRAYAAVFNGLSYIPQMEWNADKNIWEETSGRMIRIGELPRDKDYDTTLILHFAGKDYNIRVSNTIRWIDPPAGSDYDPEVTKVPDITSTVWVDGKRLEGTYFSITVQ